jgi:uncharacterized protein (DUF2252 family)
MSERSHWTVFRTVVLLFFFAFPALSLNSPAKLEATSSVELVGESNKWLLDRRGELAMKKFALGAKDPIKFFTLFPAPFFAEMNDPSGKFSKSEFESERTSKMWIIGNVTPDSFIASKPDGKREVYDIGDYFHAGVGSYRLDFLRLSVFIALLGRKIGLDRFELDSLLDDYADQYAKTVLSGDSTLVVNESVARRKHAFWAVEALRKAEYARRSEFLKKYCSTGTLGKRLFLRKGPLGEPTVNLRGYFKEILASYVAALVSKGVMTAEDRSDFRYKDAVSFDDGEPFFFGVNRYWILVTGETASLEDDRVLALFEATSPALAPFYDAGSYENQAARIIKATAQFTGPASRFTGSAVSSYGELFLARLYDHTETRADLDKLTKLVDLRIHARLAAEILATAHMRANPSFSEEMKKLLGDEEALKRFTEETSWFAARYVIQVEEATRALITKLEKSPSLAD